MENPPSHGRKRIALALAAALTLTGAGAAFAYWTAQGTGTGEATTGASVDFTITSETAVGELAPGNPGQTVAFTVTNSTDGPQRLTNVTVAIADESGDPWEPTGGCLLADYDATITTAPTYGDIAALGEVDGVVTVTLENTGENQDACQGQVVPLYFTAS